MGHPTDCSILIVDDEKINVVLLKGYLKNTPYSAIVAHSGEEALRLAKGMHPDIILLDVMMPGMSGFEVARQLKGFSGTRNIPIIMVTALNDSESRLKALECGAEEFLTKPVLGVELLFRIRNLLKLKKYQDFLAAHSDQLEEQVAEGHLRLNEAQAKLVEAEKLASIGQLAAGVAHEINNPIGFVKSNFGSLKAYVEDVLEVLNKYEAVEPLLPPDDEAVKCLREFKVSIDLAFLREDIRDLIDQSQDGIDRVAKIIQDLKSFARHDDQPVWVATNLHACLDSALNVVGNEIKYRADVVKEYGAIPDVECLPAQLGQVVLNLLVNAAQAIGDGPSRGTITVRSGCLGDQEVWVEIGDTGCGMTPDQIRRIFEPFYTTKPVGVGTGLGLSISYGIVQRHGGRIEVDSAPGKGTIFRVILPVQQCASEAEPAGGQTTGRPGDV